MNPSKSQFLLALTACSVTAMANINLLNAWRDDPHLRTGGLAFTVWIVGVLGHAYISHRSRRRSADPAIWILIMVMIVLSWMSTLHVLGHLGLAAAGLIAARNNLRAEWLLLAGALSWIPATGWLIQALVATDVDQWRVLLVSVAVIASLVAQWPKGRPNPGQPLMNPTSPHPSSLALFAIVVVFVALATWFALPIKPSQTSLDDLPVSGPNFVSRAVPLEADEARRLHGAQAIKRICRNHDQLFWLVAIDGTENRHAVHDPLYCLRGQGWSIVNQYEIPIANGVGKRYSLTRDGESKAFIYWFSSGSAPFHAMTRYWAESSARRLTKGRSGSEPILYYVVPINRNSEVQWQRILESATVLVTAGEPSVASDQQNSQDGID